VNLKRADAAVYGVSRMASGANRRNSAELMYVQCASCREWLDVKPGRMNEITHTICPKCMKSMLATRKKTRDKKA
jgi:hypothetical protein